MPVVDPMRPDLGPDFDRRWRRASRALRRELIAEVRSIYKMLEDDNMPLLAGAPAHAAAKTNAPMPSPTVTPRIIKPQQASLFNTPDTTAAPVTARGDNPFLPPSVRERLQHSQSQTHTQLQALQQRSPLPVSHEQVDLERELRLRLGPVIETLVESHLESIKNELRTRLRVEMDQLIVEHLRK